MLLPLLLLLPSIALVGKAWGQNCDYTPQCSVTSANNPVGYPSGPVFVGTVMTFTAQTPSDTDTCGDDRQQVAGGPITIHWSFGDGTTADGISVTHSFASAGNYTVTATFQDTASPPVKDSDVSAIASVSVSVYTTTSPPTTPSLENDSCGCNCSPWEAACSTDPGGGCGGFEPLMGGLAPTFGGYGPVAGDPVQLVSGAEDYRPSADLSVYNPYGPALEFRRSFRTDRALGSYGSPGLTTGWVHGFDLKITAANGSSWSDLTLTYPNGASEVLTPTVVSGSATFTVSKKVPYLVAGSPSGTTGVWNYLNITWGDRTEWRFERLGTTTTYVLARITNKMGKALSLVWTSDRRLDEVKDYGNNTTLLDLIYNGSSQLTDIKDLQPSQTSDQRKVSYEYNGSGHLQRVSKVGGVNDTLTGSSNKRWEFTYTTYSSQPFLATIAVPSPEDNSTDSTATLNYSNGRVISRMDANGNTTYYVYNSSDTRVETRDSSNAFVGTYSAKFDSSSNRYRSLGTVDAEGNATFVEYGESNAPRLPTKVTLKNNLGVTYTETTYTYEVNSNVGYMQGNLKTVTTPIETTTNNYTYSSFALGELSSVVVGSGSSAVTKSSYTYDSYGNVKTVVTPKPGRTYPSTDTVTTTYTYDYEVTGQGSLGNLRKVETPGDTSATVITTTYDYTAGGTVTAKMRQPLTMTDNLSHVWTYTYDARGNQASSQDPLGSNYKTLFAYNLANQLTETQYPDTSDDTATGRAKTVNTYQYVGGPLRDVQQWSESGGKARQTGYAYGKEGELIEEKALLLATSAYQKLASYTYDALYRRKTLVTYQDATHPETTTYTYDRVGRLTKIEYPGTDSVQYTKFDAAGRALERRDGNDDATQYTYGVNGGNLANGLLASVTYPTATAQNVSYEYDGHGRRSKMTDATGETTYTYDDADQPLSMTSKFKNLSTGSLYGWQAQVSYTYYADGGRATMSTPAGTFEYTYDGDRQPDSVTDPDADVTSWSYQDNHWLSVQTFPTGDYVSHGYNQRGFETTLTNSLQDYPASSFASKYDAVGNRKELVAGYFANSSYNGTTAYTYDDKDQLTQESSTRNGGTGYPMSFSYDQIGNPTSFKGASYTFNLNNQFTNTGFSYDGNGNPTAYAGPGLTFGRENRMVAYGSALSAGYNGDGLRAWKQTSSGTTYFVYDGEQLVCEMDTSGNVTACNIWGANGLIGRKTSSATTYYLYDSQGTVAQTFDAGSAIQTTRMYDAWGNLMLGTHPSSDPYGYNGQWGYYRDTETSLLLLTHRYYDAARGRFLTRDPIGDEGGANLYGYVGNNPATYIDPSGTVSFRNCDPDQVRKLNNALWFLCTRASAMDWCMDRCSFPVTSNCASDLCSGASTLTIDCAGGPACRSGACAVSGSSGTVYICPPAWTPKCPSMFCILGHEFAHVCGQRGHPSGGAHECVGAVFPSCR